MKKENDIIESMSWEKIMLNAIIAQADTLIKILDNELKK